MLMMTVKETTWHRSIPKLAHLDLKLPHREACGFVGLRGQILNSAWIQTMVQTLQLHAWFCISAGFLF